MSDAATARAVAVEACPVCDRPAVAVFLSAAEVAAELDARARFFARRLDRRVPPAQLRDLTDVALGTPAAILHCPDCDVLVRDEPQGDELFREDRYEQAVLESLHETHVRAFRVKEADYRALLPAGARVVEVGCYVGGFLTAAEEWGWSAIGIDIGRDPVRFCRSLGHDARCRPLPDCRFDAGSFDAVFVWNCFEQLSDPGGLLAEARRILRTAGLLTIRVPDAAFFIRCHQQPSLGLLAYNGLLGWTSRFGFNTGSLRRLVEGYGFAFDRVLRRPAMRPLRDAMRPWARAEEAALIGDGNHGWIELTWSAEAAPPLSTSRVQGARRTN